MRSEFALLALRDDPVAAAWLQSRRAFGARFAQALVAMLARAGLRLTVDADDAAEALRAIFESAVRHALLEHPDGPVHPESVTRLLPGLLRAMTGPLGPSDLSGPIAQASD
jgi:hypothetical protein